MTYNTHSRFELRWTNTPTRFLNEDGEDYLGFKCPDEADEGDSSLGYKQALRRLGEIARHNPENDYGVWLIHGGQIIRHGFTEIRFFLDMLRPI